MTNPANNAQDIPVSDSAIATDAYPPVLTALFSEPLDPDTVNNTTFIVNGVTGTVSYNVPSQMASFTPAEPLTPSTVYTATITTGVTDMVGNALAVNHVWQFTTTAEVAIEVILPLPDTTEIDFGPVNIDST